MDDAVDVATPTGGGAATARVEATPHGTIGSFELVLSALPLAEVTSDGLAPRWTRNATPLRIRARQ